MTDTDKAKKTESTKRSTAKKRPSVQNNALSRYLRETRGEVRKVTWPTRDESWRLTAIVLAVTIAFSIFLWVFDTIFSNSIQFLLEQLLI